MAKGTKQQDSIQIEKLAEQQKRALEEEERKKKERERIKALYYFTAAYLDRVERRKALASLRYIDKFKFYGLLDSPVKKKLLQSCQAGIKYAECKAKIAENKRKFFLDIIPTNDFDEVRKSINATNFSEDTFATLAMCAARTSIRKCCDFIFEKSFDEDADKDLNQIKIDCVTAAKKALGALEKGKPQEVADLLKDGLEYVCKAFADAKEEDEMIEYSSIADEIIFVIDEHPELAKVCDIKPHQMDIARKVADLGDDLRRGLMAVEVLIAAEQKDNIVLTSEQRADMMGASLRMKAAIAEKQALAKNWEKQGPVLQLN